MEDWDVIVVGAGPAGSLAALGALRARPGARVLLLDRADFPRDKVCGDALGPACLSLLAAVGLGSVTDGYPEQGQFELASRRISARHPLASPVTVVPRAVLDARLRDAAVAAGAVARTVRVRDVAAGPDAVVLDGQLRTPVLVGADGAESVVRRAVLPAARRSAPVAVSVRGYGPTRRDVPLIMSAGSDWPSYAWEFPLGDGTANIGYIATPAPGTHPSRAEMLEQAVALLPDSAPGVTEWRGHRLPMAPARPYLPDGRVLLVGDAAALVNPSSGEGIFDALLSGWLAGASAHEGAGAGAAYRTRLRRAHGRHQRHAALVARACRSDRLAEAGLRLAARDAGFFRSISGVALGDGALGPLVTARAVVRDRVALLSRRS
ncbi:geranylgeranyl reductase family protein [Motilibacter rhizosphaerae]|uniref:Geranylgeranyl reductase family protein n=1 Tax=Motilibacter rhizosphaerae TaxID=598652 RepID=A0A4Q7NWH6_9ACTN|nr:geranylgeranyl reductase family protein [Motilibacter rhizosphaerae]RZS91666.1 geranylgeranyl reductase family protein [Motilibacter rhizosphaerae]